MPPRRRTPEATIDALIFDIRTRGRAAIDHVGRQHRILVA
jgi:hypothetical protein